MLLIADWGSLLYNQSKSINLEPAQNFGWKNGTQGWDFLGMLPALRSLTADPAKRFALGSRSPIVELVTRNSESPLFKFSSLNPEVGLGRVYGYYMK